MVQRRLTPPSPPPLPMVTPPYTPTCDSPGPSVAFGVVPSLVVCVLRRAPCGVVGCGVVVGFGYPPLSPLWCGVVCGGGGGGWFGGGFGLFKPPRPPVVRGWVLGYLTPPVPSPVMWSGVLWWCFVGFRFFSV